MLSWLLCALDVWEVGCRIVCWTLWLKFGWWVLAKNILTRSAFFILKNWFISVMHFPLILTVIFVGSVLICFMLCCWCCSVFLFCFVVYWFVIVVYFKIVFSFGLCFCLVYFWFGFCGVVAVFCCWVVCCCCYLGCWLERRTFMPKGRKMTTNRKAAAHSNLLSLKLLLLWLKGSRTKISAKNTG